MHVLVIEDFQEADSGLRGHLEKRGHIVEVVGCGIFDRNVLTWVGRYDAIVLDLIASEMDGIKLCRKLREEGCRITPILLISAIGSLNEKIAGLEAGADDVLFRFATLTEIESRLRVLFRLGASAKVGVS